MTNTIDKDILVLALASIGIGNARDVAVEYERRVLNNVLNKTWSFTDDIVAPVTRALIDLLDEKRARKILGTGTVRFGLMPVVGMAATVAIGTDRHAATVVEVSPSGHKVTVRQDKATRTDANGMSESQSYKYESDPNGKLYTFYRRGDGKYGKLILAARRTYHDYSF